MNRTHIEWTDFSWNPVTGCLNNCSYCYARRIAERFRGKYRANSILPEHDEPDHELHHADPFYPRFWPSRIDDPALLRSEFNKIFVCSMGELFGDWVPEEWQREVINVAETCVDQTFQFLTKCPQNLPKWNPWPENAWVGVTATDQDMFNKAMAYLANVEAKVRFVSLEPLREHVVIEPLHCHLVERPEIKLDVSVGRIIDQIIVGAMTNPYVPPEKAWVQEIIDAADKAGVSIFLKDNLRWPIQRREWPNAKKGIETNDDLRNCKR